MVGRVLRIMVCFVLGVFFAIAAYIGIGRSIGMGYYVRWHKLPMPPAHVEEFVIGAHGTVYARTEPGLVYRCSAWRDECWVQDEIPQDTSYLMDATVPCDSSAPEFSWTANAPSNPVICVQGEEIYADCFGKDVYLLDEDDAVWEWSNTVCASSGLAMLLLCVSAVIGVGMGSVVGVVWSRWLGRRKSEDIPAAETTNREDAVLSCVV